MNNSNKNSSFRPGQREVDEITKRARKGGRDGAVIGGAAGYLAGALAPRGLRKARLVGAAVGAGAGYATGKVIGRKVAAKDDIASRRALREMQDLRLQVEAIKEDYDRRELDRLGNFEPGASGQHPVPIFPKSKRKDTRQVGIDDEGDYQLTEERQALADEFGWGIVSQLPDEMLTREHAQALLEEVRSKMAKANGPRASSNTDPEFARAFLGPNAAQMSDKEVICHFEFCRRNGLVELEDAEARTDLALVNRVRNDEGEFAPESQVNSQAVQRAYARNPKDRTTGKTASTVGALGAAAGLAGAIAHLRGRKRRAPRLTAAGSPPALPGAIGADFAARAGDDEQGHGARNAAIAGAAGAGLTIAGLLAARRLRRGRVPRLTGTQALPPRTSPPTYDVETQVMSRRLPLLTQLAMGKVGSYKIRRANLKGKRPPTGIHPRQLGKAKPKNFGAFLINDPDFPLVPQKDQKLPPGMKRRVPLARTRAEVLKRLKAITALSREFGVGAVVAEGLVDALGVGAATTPKKKKVMVDKFGNVLNPTPLPDPGTSAQSSFTSAIERLHSFGIGAAIGQGAARYLPEAAVIGSADLVAERANAAIEARKKRQKRLVRQRGGIQATPGMGTAPGVQTTMSAVHDTLLEFDHGNARIDRAKRNGTAVAAVGVGGVAGAIGGLKYDQGRPVHPKDVRPGDILYRRFGPANLVQHHGVVGTDGNVTHRTARSDSYRSIKPESFRKIGRGPTYREDHPDNLPRAKAAKNASRAAGTPAGRYRVGVNDCQGAASRLATRRVPGTGQLKRAGIGAAIGALGSATVASVLNRKNRKDK